MGGAVGGAVVTLAHATHTASHDCNKVNYNKQNALITPHSSLITLAHKEFLNWPMTLLLLVAWSRGMREKGSWVWRQWQQGQIRGKGEGQGVKGEG